MDKLKHFIDTHPEAFDDDQLPEGHFDRFEQKLPAARKRNIWLYSLSTFAAAASIALFLWIGIPNGIPVPANKQASAGQTCETKQEIDELRTYYTMQMNDVIARMEVLYKQEQTPGTTGLLQETKRILKDNYMFEETILPTLPCSNDGLYAMNQHYANSLESLNFMLEQMKQVTKEDLNK